MKISAVYDPNGHVISAQEHRDGHGATATLQLVAGPGQRHATFEAPTQFAGKDFAEFAHLLHVNVKAANPSLSAK